MIVDGDADTRDRFAETLQADGCLFPVIAAGSLEQAFELLRARVPDVLVVDLALPDGSGLDLVRCAWQLSADTRVLVCTAHDDEASVIGAVEAGARGYLLKSEAPHGVRVAVRQLIAGGAPLSPGAAAHLVSRFAPQELPLSAAVGRDADLTQREREVLELLVRGLSYKDAAEALGVTRNTLTSHVKKVYRKLDVSSRGAAVFEALSQGIVLMDRDE